MSKLEKILNFGTIEKWKFSAKTRNNQGYLGQIKIQSNGSGVILKEFWKLQVVQFRKKMRS